MESLVTMSVIAGPLKEGVVALDMKVSNTN